VQRNVFVFFVKFERLFASADQESSAASVKGSDSIERLLVIALKGGLMICICDFALNNMSVGV
jgi:hypothetical protein